MSLSFDPQRNTLIEYDIAPVSSRIVATIIDWVIISVYYVIAFAVLIMLVSEPGTRSARYDNVFDRNSLLVLLIFVPVIFYDLFFEIVMRGQSPGKKLMKIRVMKVDGSEPGFAQYFIRWILKIVDSWLLYGIVQLIAVAAGGKGQRLGDMAAGTRVIDLKRERVSLEGTIFDAERQ